MRRGDWVMNLGNRTGYIGCVLRVARDGTWADVRWRVPDLNPPEWTKRMPTAALELVRTIPLGGGWHLHDFGKDR